MSKAVQKLLLLKKQNKLLLRLLLQGGCDQ